MKERKRIKVKLIKKDGFIYKETLEETNIEVLKNTYIKGINLDECSEDINPNNLPSIYFKIASFPLPEIIFDSYQEDLGINKIQPKGWNKQGVWIGYNNEKPISYKKIEHTIKSKIIIKEGIDGTVHVFTKQLDNIYEKD